MARKRRFEPDVQEQTTAQKLINKHLKFAIESDQPRPSELRRKIGEMIDDGNILHTDKVLDSIKRYMSIERTKYALVGDFSKAKKEAWANVIKSMQGLKDISLATSKKRKADRQDDDEDEDDGDSEDDGEDEDDAAEEITSTKLFSTEKTSNIVGGVRARFRCPLCGMVGDIFENKNQKLRDKGINIPTLDRFPYEVNTWKMFHGGFIWNEEKKKREGRIEYQEVPEARMPVLLLMLKGWKDLGQFILESLIEEGAEIPDDLSKAADIMEKVRVEAIWAQIENAMGDIDDAPGILGK